jgi:hypothetical protein
MEATTGRFDQNFKLGSEVAGKFPTIRRASTGRNDCSSSVFREEMLELRQCRKWLFKIVKTELDKRSLFNDGAGFFKHLGGCGASNGDTDFADAGAEKLGGYCGHIHSHVYNRGILQCDGAGCNFLLKKQGVSLCLLTGNLDVGDEKKLGL